MQFLTSGSVRGLGRFLHENMGGTGISRAAPLSSINVNDEPVRAIIHCAFNMSRDITASSLRGYLDDSLFLTEALTRVPHDMFIQISTIDVYPKNEALHAEEEEIDVHALDDLYALTKLECESIVQANCPRHLILRPGLLLGPYMRPNNLTRLVRKDQGRITLSADSSFYCVLYEDVLAFIRQALDEELTGVFNLVHSDKVTMGQIANVYDPDSKFGTFTYRAGNISNTKIAHCCPLFTGDTLIVIEKFVAAWPTKEN